MRHSARNTKVARKINMVLNKKVKTFRTALFTTAACAALLMTAPAYASETISVTTANGSQESVQKVGKELSNNYAIVDKEQADINLVHTELPNGDYKLTNSTVANGQKALKSGESWVWK